MAKVLAGDLIEIVQKENNGWWLAKSGLGQAWVPATYVEEQAPAPAPIQRAPPPPPAMNGAGRNKPTPPAKRPAATRKADALPARDSGMSMNENGSDGSRSNTPNLGSLRLADALIARKNAMQRRDEDDDW
ncbi:hypothetical protein NUW58_g10780 [Xylaria curta]|uniref:Uncharacterized protein n=1 Tax=Xylaria curta TaxID=42375 RepID=A0ACC1MGC3_9PEZI|nr:hypothetical protein NUW58_g10780 [Xylaria curta]